jgi:TRAP transporter TAXI family solute receptor
MMIKIFKGTSVGVLAGALFAMAGFSETVSLGTTKGGATAQISTAIAKVISERGDIQMRPQPMANTSQYIPMVDAGDLDFGIANNPQTWYAVNGSGMSKTAAKNLRIVATLFPFQAGIVVPSDLGISSFAELAGKTVPRFPDNSLGDFIIRAALNAGDLDYSDVKSVPVSNFPRMWDAMKQGQTHISIAAVGSKPTYDLEAALSGITFLPFDLEDEAKLAELLPGCFVMEIAPDKDVPGIANGTRVFAYDYLLFANKNVSDSIITSTLTALYEGESGLKSASPMFSRYVAEKIGKSLDIEYHPAALAFFKSKGIK